MPRLLAIGWQDNLFVASDYIFILTSISSPFLHPVSGFSVSVLVALMWWAQNRLHFINRHTFHDLFAGRTSKRTFVVTDDMSGIAKDWEQATYEVPGYSVRGDWRVES